MTEDMQARGQVDLRGRHTARVASWFCATVAAVSIAYAALSLAAALAVTQASMASTGRDPITAFLTANETSGTVVLQRSEYGGNVTLYGNPVQVMATGVAKGALAGAAFVVAWRMCRRIARTGRAFSPERVRELRTTAVLPLLSGCVPTALAALGNALSSAAVRELLGRGEAVAYGLVPLGSSGFDLGLVALGVLLVAITKIFEYGCVLQRQDDETL
ncbi:DUF2975 domain-containing protein [Olsenella uli]|uniref:DUF2975 domain-containing protein n=1 Tax=Olsenella uli TaxID=133926 RepID=UPI00195E5176|nr:DUF2975 domain-containing protein [Olsenella uli]MBM6817080.1 DUF2975 domain-containing protein [Olsenella uli]